jgi:tetratricopeptide (TPR) repeat protein
VYCTNRADALVAEGVALHDKGLYEDALKKYDAALAIKKEHYLANYEKSYTLLSLKRYEESITLSKYILTNFQDGSDNMSVYINYGNCLDYLGKAGEAIMKYDEGIKKYPDAGLIYFNKAITQYGMKRVGDGIETDKLSIKKNPYHASSHHFMSVAVGKSNKVLSLLASLAFLAIEQEGERAEYHLSNAETMIGMNVKKTGDNSTTITLSLPDEKNKNTADDFHMVELSMSLSVALNQDKKYEKETPVERMERNLGMVFSSLGVGQKDGKGFGWTYYAPFFTELNHQKYVNTFCHIIYTSSGDEKNNKWLTENAGKVDEFKQWFKNYTWNKEG